MNNFLVDAVQRCVAHRVARDVGLGFLKLCGLRSSLVVVAEVASLAHSDRVVQFVGVFAGPGQLVAAELAVARRAHVLGVVFAVNVRALCDLHRVVCVLSGSLIFDQGGLDLGSVGAVVDLINLLLGFQGHISLGWSDDLGSLLSLAWLDEFQLQEILKQLGVQFADGIAAAGRAGLLHHHGFRKLADDFRFQVSNN